MNCDPSRWRLYGLCLRLESRGWKIENSYHEVIAAEGLVDDADTSGL